MEIKKHPPAGGEENKKQATVLKFKINSFLINYFNYLIIFLSIIILAAGLLILVYPKYQQISKVDKEAKNKLEIEYAAKFNYLSSIRNLKKSYQSINDDEKEKIAVMLPAKRDTGIIITEIESIVVKNGAILSSIKIEPQSAVGRTNLRVDSRENMESTVGIFNQSLQGTGIIKIEVSLSSVDYQIFKNIIKVFENNLRLFDIFKVSFNARDNQAFLSIYSYYLQ